MARYSLTLQGLSDRSRLHMQLLRTLYGANIRANLMALAPVPINPVYCPQRLSGGDISKGLPGWLLACWLPTGELEILYKKPQLTVFLCALDTLCDSLQAHESIVGRLRR